MLTLEIKRDVLTKARDRAVLNSEERSIVETKFAEITSSTHTLEIALHEMPVPYWRAMLDDSRLTVTQRTLIARHVFGMKFSSGTSLEIYEAEVSDPVEFGSTFATLGTKQPNAEMFWNGRWYPVIVNCRFIEDEGKIARDVQLALTLSICELTLHRSYQVFRDLFLDQMANPVSRRVADVLNNFGLRQLQTSHADFNLRLVKAERLARETGSVMLISGPVIVNSEQAWWSGVESQSLGASQVAKKAVVDAELEVQEERRSYFAARHYADNEESRLPFVRLFSLDIKRYVYVDVDDLAEYEFDVEAIENLCLPADMLSVLTRVFDTPLETVFGDLIRGKHGGVVILASGHPGVGKTLTAEIYAERTERPLYILEMGELGTTAKEVEEQLRNVFGRVTRWNAVLQFDECEVFLSQRNNDLERSAIVGIFLRLLDYYQGILFLTSNRPEVIDEAVLSRVMLHLRYPDLGQDERVAIWRNMFKAANVEVEEDVLATIAEWRLNGREIRNIARLARILFPNTRLTAANMGEARRYANLHAPA
ncbi:MAG: AAA family ATPase [Planctomycetaceae bacterium]|nr:AAA family ATPase [Planctomycetaceae bacterium]